MAFVSSTLLRPDLCVIGAGRAGIAIASGAAALGVPTVVIDRRDLVSALPRAGEIARLVLRGAAIRRLEAGRNTAVDWNALKSKAIAAAESRASGMSATHLRALGIQVIQGTACFADRLTIEAGGVAIRPRGIILATGVTPAVPALPGLDRAPWFHAERWLDLVALPEKLIVLGAGRTGIELAQVFGRLGSAVTLIDGTAPLRGFDPELSAPVLGRLHREGIDIRAGRTVVRAEPDGTGSKLFFKDTKGQEESVRGDCLLLATGWRPAVDDLRLDRAGIRLDPQGIAVSPDGRTGNHRVFALGDVAGRGRSTEAAEAQVGVVLRAALFHRRASFDPRRAPRILRADPEIAVVGLTEAEARSRHGAISVWRWPYAENDRARTEGPIGGHIKVLTTKSGRILGAGIVGREAAETIGLWTLAVAQKLSIKDVAALPLPVGAYADLCRRAALQATLAGLDGPWLKRALKVVRWMDRRL